MRHHPLLIALTMLGLTAAIPSSAQMPFAGGEQQHLFVSGDGDGLEPVPQDYRPAFSTSTAPVPSQAPRPLYTSPEGVTVWGNVVYARSWGDDGEIPCFNAYNCSSSGLAVSQVFQDQWIFANGSGAFYDGKFRFISKGYTTYLYAVYDVDTWTQTYQEMSPYKFHKLVASDCDYDPVSGLTYGCFWNPDTKEYEFASVDYESCTHNTIAPMEMFSAIAINSKGVVYGIKEADGGLYTIDKKTGAQTFIGLTGAKPYLIQSAAFDRSSDVLYWAVRSEGSVAWLARVNTDTGAATRLAYLPDNEQITCLYVPYQASGAVPGKINGINLSIEPGSSDVSLEFTMPASAADGSSLSGDMDYTVTLAGETVRTAKAAPGAKVNVSFQAPQGYSAIAVVASNDKGKGIPAERRIWCGNDTPSKVTDVNISIDNANGNKVKLTWKGSETGIHGGYIGLSNITYDVVRMPEGKLVASRQTATSFTETLGNGMAGVYHYVVTPYANDIPGESVESARVSATGSFSVPYVENFDSESGFESFVTIDANGDSKDWFWHQQMQCVQYYVNWSKDADDWLLTPELSLVKDKLYLLSFDCQGWNEATVEKLAVSIGKGTDPSIYADIMPESEIRSGEMQTYRFIFSVPEDGDYRIGYHCTSSRYAMYILLDNVAVTDGPTLTTPGMVTDVAIEPEVSGLLSASLKFKTPAADVSGNELKKPVNIEIYRNDEETPFKVLTGLEPGSVQEYTDDAVTVTGVNKYIFIATDGDKKGLPAEASAYIGQDRPQSPQDVTLTDNEDHYTLSWTAPGTEGVSWPPYPVIPSSLTYNVYAPDRSLLTEGVEGLTFDLPESYVTGSQGLLSFHVTGVSPAGEGAMESSNAILTGKPYDLPLRESFKEGRNPETFWWTKGGNSFYPNADKAYDDDGGCIRWKDGYEKTTWFNSAKLNIAPAQTPTFSFAYWTLPGKKLKIMAYVSPEGGDDILLGQIDFTEETGEEGWRTASFDLTPHKEGKFAIVKLYAESQETYDWNNPTYLFVDQISVVDAEGANLTAAALSAPSSIYVNQTGQIRVVVQNSASKGVGYKVNLYADGNLVDSRDIPYIAPLSQESVSFTYTPTILSAESVEFYADIECGEDLFPADNATGSAVSQILRPDYPVVNDLSASFGNGAVDLAWSEPAQNAGEILESFEDYLHKDRQFGSWVNIDQDMGNVYTNQIVDVGYHNVPMAWAVFNSIAAGVPEEEADFYAAHTGTTSLLAFASQPESVKKGEGNDDWLISPELSCSEAHDLTFWAKAVKGDKYGPESFEVLYSTGFPNLTESFVSLGTFSAPQAWTRFSIQIPQGARFFAIRYTTVAGFYLMLDDIEFQRGVFDVTGYCIFRDGKKIAEVPATAKSFSDFATDVTENHAYHVTVKYANGESDMSNTAIYDTSGIKDLTDFPEGPFDVFSVDGIRVLHNATDLTGLPRGIYIVNHRKVIVR